MFITWKSILAKTIALFMMSIFQCCTKQSLKLQYFVPTAGPTQSLSSRSEPLVDFILTFKAEFSALLEKKKVATMLNPGKSIITGY